MSVIRIVSTVHSCLRSASLIAAAGMFAAALASAPARADDYDATLKDIQSTMGGVPSFVKQFPKAGLPGAWAEVDLAPQTYTAGSWGPSSAIALIERDGASWHD